MNNFGTQNNVFQHLKQAQFYQIINNKNVAHIKKAVNNKRSVFFNKR